jgi:predicted RND superfamily exporter protein
VTAARGEAGRTERRTLRFARLVVRNRGKLATLLVLATLFFLYPIANAVLTALGHPLAGPVVRLDSRARDLFPDHPFIHAQDKFAGRFGNSSTVVVAVVVRDGTVFTVETLRKIHDITHSLDGWGYDAQTDQRRALQAELEAEGVLTLEEIREELDQRYPPYPVNHYQVRSITHESTRVVEIDPDGGITGSYLIEDLPTSEEEAAAVRARIREKAPYLLGRLVSEDESAALVTAAFVTDRLNSREVYQAIFDHVERIRRRHEDDRHRVLVTGAPVLTGWVLAHAHEIALSVFGAVALIFALLWLYFRRGHGVAIPGVAAAVTVVWGTGFTGWADIVFDPLILVIPMIITARAVSHTVQMAERFFEDYETLFAELGDAKQAKLEAAQVAMAELIVPGTLGIITDVAGLLVILVTTIPQMRNLGIFGAFWVAAIVVTVEILHPILICYLPAPRRHEHYVPRIMVRVTDWLGRATTHPVGKWAIAGSTLVVFAASAYLALFHSQIGDANPGTPLFWPDHPFNAATAEVTERFGGADMLVIYADGDRDNASTEAAPLQAMERLERAMLAQTDARGSFSLVPLMRIAARQFMFGDPKAEVLPDDDGGARGVIFRLQINSPPGALGQLLSNDGRAATATLFYPDHKGETIRQAVHAAERFIEQNPLGIVSIRLDKHRAEPGAPLYDAERLKDLLYYMIGPLLPPRAHTLSVRVQNGDGYDAQPVADLADGAPPPWLEEFRAAALRRYEDGRDDPDGEWRFTWPGRLADWDASDVDQWWEDPERGIRAVSVNTQDLIVQDLKARDPEPAYQPTQSWTRGVQFVMAGGIMGILAAMNEEVERGHLANISLIFAVIFVLHSLTYRSATSGAIILLQIATATLLSLAYMAVKGVGLNINTLPVQAVGVGIGVDYAIYIVDRIRQEVADMGGDIDGAIRRAIRTTGMAVTFTATTVIGGILFWVFSNLRFQAEMAQLLTVLMVINMIGAVTIVPAFYSILRPRAATSLLRRARD